jgi:inosine-uridine nucleoside N-ribohydrolase
MSAAQTWQSLLSETHTTPKLFRPSTQPSADIMLDLLRSNPAQSITIVALGPLTTLAVAAARDPKAFLKVKEVVSMGGAINVPGNV